MPNATRSGGALMDASRYVHPYLAKLLIERFAIRAPLENGGGSVILTGVAATTESSAHYSSVIGNDFHLDLIEAESIVAAMPKEQRSALMSWANGLTSQQAAHWHDIPAATLRKRRSRGVSALASEMNHDAAEGAGTTGDGPSQADGEGSTLLDEAVGSH